MATATKTAVCYLLCAALSASVPAAEVPAVRHPNLLLNRQEIEQVRAKVRRHEWAARLLDRVKEMAKDPGRNIRETALAYALTGEKRYADQARRHLTGQARHGIGEYEKLDLKLHPEYGAWTPWGTYAWAYDLTHETFSPEERQLVERWLRMACKAVIEGEKLWTTTPNLVFGKHFNVALVGYCLGDRELIEWGLNDPGAHGPRRGGFYQVLDSMINDGRFWGETPIYALHYDVHGMLALAEAAMHYDGTDLYRHVSKASGASIKSVIDGYIRMGFPVEQTGASSIRMATYGDGSTSYSPGGKLWETFLVPGDLFPGNLEVAYKRYKDPAYGWIIGLNRKRDAFVSYGRAVWGYVALTHGEPLGDKLTPPAAPSGVYSQQGFAFLRADETPAYWTSGALAAMVMLGKPIGHGHNDFYSLVLHGKGRLLYPDLNVIQYEPTYLRWTREGIAHSTLLVDHESPRGGPFTTRHEFTDDVKFLALRGSAFEDIDQSRVLLLTREYLADFFHAADRNGRERAMDWVLHGLGRLYPGGPATFRATHDLVPFYWWIDNEKSRTVDGTWRADWIQSSAGLTRGLQFGPEWFAQTAGVRMTMLGAAGTRVYCGDGPITDGPPYGRIDGNPEGSSPMVLARRKAAATTFAAVHEAYRDRPSVGRVSRLAEDDHAVAIVVAAPAFTDFVLAAFDGKEHTLAASGGLAFSFSNYAYLRVAGGSAVARGGLRGFRLPAATVGANARLAVNGKAAALRGEGQFVVYGQLPERLPAGEPVPPAAETAESSADLHYWFQPAELHLSAKGAKAEGTVDVHVRSVGGSRAAGALRLDVPEGLHAEPARLEIPAMAEGKESVLRLKLRASPAAAGKLLALRLAPEQGTPAARGELPVSVGVVMQLEHRLPGRAQYVVRAPGYTFAVDEFSGVSSYILDADGHRRHGRMYNTNFIFGIPGVQRDGKWCFQYRHPCRFIWTQPNGLIVGCDGNYNDHDARLGYTFEEDRIVISLIPPTRADVEQTVWLGNFDALGEPRQIKQPAGAPERFFFPHPAYRQGLLIELPAGTKLRHLSTAVNFPLKVAQQVVLRFAAEAELTPASSATSQPASLP